MKAVLIAITAQIGFSFCDIYSRYILSLSPVFLGSVTVISAFLYIGVHIVSTGLQLKVLSMRPLGSVMALFAALSVVAANIAGYFLLEEQLSATQTAAVICSILALVVLAFPEKD